MNAPENQDPPKGWILYDDTCGFCRRWIPFWQNALWRRGFSIATLQEDWVREKLELSETELLRDVQLLLADGTYLTGADVYRYATRRIWWALPVYVFSITPGFRNLFDWGYRKFANNRHRISDVCRLDAPEQDK